MFYSLNEVSEKFSMAKEQVKELVKAGRLREFRDGPNLLFKVDEVEALLSDTSFMQSVKPPASSKPETEKTPQEGEVILQPEEKGASAPESTPSEPKQQPAEDETEAIEAEISLADATDEAPTTGSDITSADTALSNGGTDVLGDTDNDYALAEDTKAETQAISEEPSLEEIEEDVNLDSFGSGSGLLDLSLQADDTSLGGVLDDIYTSEIEQEQQPVKGSAVDVAAEAESLEEQTSEAAAVPAMMHPYIEPEPDTGSKVLGLMLFLPLLIVIYTAIVTMSASIGVMPLILEKTQGLILFILGGFLLATLVISGTGFMLSANTGKPKKVKKKKAKKAPPPATETKK